MQKRPLGFQPLANIVQLGDYLVEPTTPADMRKAYASGAVGLITGVVVATVMIWALPRH